VNYLLRINPKVKIYTAADPWAIRVGSPEQLLSQRRVAGGEHALLRRESGQYYFGEHPLA